MNNVHYGLSMMVQGKIPYKDHDVILQYAYLFVESLVDGDLLLQFSEDMPSKDIKMSNGILRLRVPLRISMSSRSISSDNCNRRSPSTRLSSNESAY